MLRLQPALVSPNTADAGLTPVVQTFTGLAAQGLPQDPLESLERYKLVARLGHGGMAEVFLAAWEVAPFVHRPVVIKRLHEHFTEDQNLVQMFLDEARLLTLLDHPHVIKTLEAGVIEGRCCIAMEYLEGQPLHRVLRCAYQRGKLAPELAVSIAISMLEGLNYAHDARDAEGQALEIVHRDVSPHNVFVTNEGLVKVLDFGIAKATSHEGRTATGIVKGKIGYIAPEQAAAEVVDRRADVWSAGVVLWEALTGTRLFKAETDAGTLNLALKGPIPSPSSKRPDLPAELDAVLARALQRIPPLRYRTAAAMQKDLEAWLSGAGHSRGPQPLAALMRDLFSSEIVEQRRLVSMLMARSDCTPPSPSSNRSPSSTSALIVSNPSPTALDLTNVNSRVDELNQRHRRAYRSLSALLAVFAGFAFGVVYFVVSRLNPSAAQPPAVAARDSSTTMPAQNTASALRVTIEKTPQAPPAPPAPVAAATRTNPPARGPLRRVTPTAGAVAWVAPPVARFEPSASFGFLTIDTSPWSLVSVGGKLLGQTPLVGIKLPSGNQVLALRNPELGIQTSYTVTIEPGKTLARRIGIE